MASSPSQNASTEAGQPNAENVEHPSTEFTDSVNEPPSLEVKPEEAGTSSDEIPEPPKSTQNYSNPRFLDVDGFDNAEIERLSEAIDKFRELELERDVALPQLVVTGNQSSGKSSLLESLTGVPFPKGVGICTRYATEITLRSSLRDSVEFSIAKTEATQRDRRARIDKFGKQTYPKLDADSFRILLAKIAAVFWGEDHASTGTQAGNDFAREMLKIEISGPGLKPLKFIDTPGLYSSESQKQTKEGAHLVKKLVEDLIVPNRTIIVAVMDSRVNAETQDIFELASIPDPGRVRTIGILTKCDLLPEGGEQELAVKLAQNQVIRLHHGWFTVRNRSEIDVQKQLPLHQARQFEEEFFSAPQWSTIAKMERTGIHSLKTFLGERFCHHLRDEFPKICSEVKLKLHEANKEKARLGPARGTSEEQRDFLINVAERYERQTDRYLKEDYETSIPWDHESKIWIQLRHRSEKFNNEMCVRGHFRTFESNIGHLNPRAIFNAGRAFDEGDYHYEEYDESETGSHRANDDEYDDDNTTSDQSKKENFRFEANVREVEEACEGLYDEKDNSMDEDITADSAVDAYPRNIYYWINRQYHTSVGRGLPGLVNYNLLESLFREQTRPWHRVASKYLDQVEDILTKLMHFSFNRSCPNKSVGVRVIELLKFEAKKCFKQAKKQLQGILSDERCYMQTTDPSFLTDVSNARALRLRAALKSMGKKQDDSVVINLRNAEEMQKVLRQPRCAVYDIHDLLHAYYKISLQRFIDSVVVHVVHGLLLGKDGPLKAFSRDYVRALPASVLKDVAGEDFATISERKRINDKIERLEGALDLSAKILGPAFVANLEVHDLLPSSNKTGGPTPAVSTPTNKSKGSSPPSSTRSALPKPPGQTTPSASQPKLPVPSNMGTSQPRPKASGSPNRLSIDSQQAQPATGMTGGGFTLASAPNPKSGPPHPMFGNVLQGTNNGPGSKAGSQGAGTGFGMSGGSRSDNIFGISSGNDNSNYGTWTSLAQAQKDTLESPL
ncbi:MAG: hypothetical protein M1837_000052 [Sclerophora amabilis]|nr:MAG: hypothetical protein M1837_000052 [Sclerophora amabilis]